jgi:hypothetical protein
MYRTLRQIASINNTETEAPPAYVQFAPPPSIFLRGRSVEVSELVPRNNHLKQVIAGSRIILPD